MRLTLAGMWARKGTSLAGIVVTLLAVGAALLGPMYARASAEHLLDSRIAERAPYLTGLTYVLPAMPPSEVPKGSPDRFTPPTTADLLSGAAAPLQTPAVERYWLPLRGWLVDRGGQFTYSSHTFTAPLYWRQGMCDLATLRGSCPAGAGEAAMQQTMAATLGLTVGDRFEVRYQDRYLGTETEDGRTVEVEKQRPRSRTFTVVGTYTVADPSSPAWFDLSRFTGIDDLVPPPAKGASSPPAAPALLVDPSSMTGQSVVAGADRAIDPAAVDVADMDAVESAVRSYLTPILDDSNSDAIGSVDVSSVFDEVRAERTELSRITLAALAPFVVLGLLLLYGLIASAAQARRPSIALAKLRGHSAWQVLRFALSEPYLVIAIGTPLGILAAELAAHAIASTWLIGGIPVAIDTTGLVSVVVVVAAALLAAAAAALTVIREPLAGALASSVRQRPTSRWSLVLNSAVVAVAVASVAQLVSAGDGAGQLLALLAPLFIALAIAVLGVFLLGIGTRWWMRRTARRPGTASYLASRRLARRQDLVRLMIPMLLAVSVICFAASTSATADDWRVSRARAEIGAPQRMAAATSPGHLLQVTRAVDPDGRYLAAAVVETSGDGIARRVVMDTTRLASVAAWDDSWSDVPVGALADRLSAGVGDDRLEFTGRRVTVDVRDVALRTGDRDDTTVLWLQYVDDSGEQQSEPLGELTPRGGALTATVPDCASRCLVEQLYVTADSSSVSDARGHFTLTGVRVDGKDADWEFDRAEAWRPARPFPVSDVDPAVTLAGTPGGLRVDLHLGRLAVAGQSVPQQVSGIARFSPVVGADVLPALVTAKTQVGALDEPQSTLGIHYPSDVVAGLSVSETTAPIRVVGRVAALPGIGDVGSLSDLETGLVDYEPPTGARVDVQLWAAADTPAAMLDAVRAAGIGLDARVSLSHRLEDLRGDAFSLGLRIFLLVGMATLLMAVFGVLASALTSSRWRTYEVASLRVVGVSQRSLVRASVLEYLVMLGVAVLLGVVSALVALTLVLPSVSLGTALPHDPAPVYAVHGGILALVGIGVFALAAVIALVVSRRITRLGRPSILRSAEQL